MAVQKDGIGAAVIAGILPQLEKGGTFTGMAVQKDGIGAAVIAGILGVQAGTVTAQ
jgi:hypothetical protein